MPPHNPQGALQTDRTQAAVLAPAWQDVQELGTQQESYRKPRLPNRMAPAMDVITETLLFCDGNWLQSAWIQLWLQRGRHLAATLGLRHDGQPLSAVPCPWTTRVQAQGVGVHWEVSLWSLHGQSQRKEPVLGNEPSPQQTARGKGRWGGSGGLKSQGHGKAKWEQPLVTLFRFENTTGGLKPLQEEISCQV